MKNIINSLKKTLILDGAMGTELHKKGIPDSVCPEFWMTKNKNIVIDIQEAYLKAGSNAILIPSFGANRLKLKEFGLENEVEPINRTLARITKSLIANFTRKKIFIGADIGPTGKMLEPSGTLPFETAIQIFKEQIKILIEEGVDFILIETMLDIQEARAALIAAKELSELPVIVSMSFSDSERTLSGTPPSAVVVTLQSLGADAVGANCSLGPDLLLPIVREMKKYAKIPLSVKPNAGLPKLLNGETVFDMPPETFANFAKQLVEEGAAIIGGCCGTTPEHIKLLCEKVKEIKVKKPKPIYESVISSQRAVLPFDFDKPLKIIGERINPTGKEKLKKEILSGQFREIRRLAIEQELAGADLLDVNVGASGVDEKSFLAKTISELSTTVSLPLCIDSSNPEAIEAALRVYPGRALINSISMEEKKISKLLLTAKKYSAMFILLPLGDGNLPVKAEERIFYIKEISKKAIEAGFSKNDIIVDALVLTVASNPGAPLETLKTLSWARKNSFKTIVGLSNVSFGLPAREKINSSFLSMCVANGLVAAIANPSNQEIMSAKFASDALCLRDELCASFIQRYMENQTNKIYTKPIKKDLTQDEIIREAVLKGDRGHIEAIIKEALSTGLEAHYIANELLIPAIREVGDLYNKKIYFMPQLIMSAETVKKAFEILDPLLEKREGVVVKKKTIIIATVKGDIHDIGKNIVALVLKNHGYNVIDLGKDVSPEQIFNAAKKHRPFAIGLSALMTTTMSAMKSTIDFFKKKGLTEIKFILGGAVVDADF
ncbi:MAG TPA: homocysteine S-methyltransferase family protein, partial [Victivallales bacterium]|nr:homocysteine S-methyltransferase family protein [Victivallales bacterium]